MIRNRDILNSLPLLASVLGDQYGVEVRIGGDEAKTNGKIIYLPSLPLSCDVELLATARGFLDHEAAHIRHTDFQAIKDARMDAVTFTFFNAIEDWRIERRLAEIYPGCGQNLRWLVRRLFLEEKATKNKGAGDKSPALFVLDYVLLTVRSWEVAELSIRVKSVKDTVCKVFPGLVENMDKILVKVLHHCPDTQSVILYAFDLTNTLKNWQAPDATTWPKSTRGKSNMDNSAKYDNDVQESSKKSENESGDSDTSAKTSTSSDDTGTKLENETGKERAFEEEQSNPGGDESDKYVSETVMEKAEISGGKDDLAALFALKEEELPKGLGELMGTSLKTQAIEHEECAVRVAVKGYRRTKDLSETDILEAMRTTIALRTRLSTFIQTQTRKQNMAARKGKLDTTAIYRLRIGNPKIFRKQTEYRGIDTAIHILLDASGSMMGKPIRLATLACYALAKSLENCRGISLGVTVFPVFHPDGAAVYPLLEHGTKVTPRFKVEAMGDTPLAEALWWAMQVLVKRKEARKILLILTDGHPQNRTAAEKALREAMRIGIEPYGIGLMDNNIASLLPDRSQVIKSIADLAPALFDMLAKCLGTGMGGGYDHTA